MLTRRYGRDVKLNVRLLDQTEVASGHILKNRRVEYEQSLDRLRREGRDRVAMHLNWNTKEVTKEDGAKMLNPWLLNDEEKCLIEGG